MTHYLLVSGVLSTSSNSADRYHQGGLRFSFLLDANISLHNALLFPHVRPLRLRGWNGKSHRRRAIRCNVAITATMYPPRRSGTSLHALPLHHAKHKTRTDTSTSTSTGTTNTNTDTNTNISTNTHTSIHHTPIHSPTHAPTRTDQFKMEYEEKLPKPQPFLYLAASVSTSPLVLDPFVRPP